MYCDPSVIFTDFPGEPPSDDNDELSDQITYMAAQLNAGNYRFLKLLGVFDSRDGWEGAGIMSCVHWLNWKCGMSFSTARAKVRVARCLQNHLPLINKAFSKGELSYSKVRAMTRVANDDNEEFLLMIARHGTASHMEKLVRKYQMVERLQLSDLDELQHESRQLIRSQDCEGMWCFSIKLPPEQGGILVKAIDHVVEQQNKPIHLTKAQFKQQQAAKFFNTGDSAESPVLVDTANYAQKRADALSAISEHYVASVTMDDEGGEIKALAGHERCQLVLHVDINTLRKHSCCESQVGEDASAEAASGDQAPNNAHKDQNQNKESEKCQQHDTPSSLDKQWISPDNARRLGCDASLYTVLEDEDGNVLNVGRKTRVIPPAIERALAIRDETCRFPGCTSCQYVDIHHIQHWANGGETKMGNLVKLCRFHHNQLHLGAFTLEFATKASADEPTKHKKQNNNPTLLFKAPSGEVIENEQRLPECNVEGFFEQLWPDIDSHTADSRWCGEVMDYGMAVDGLLDCIKTSGPNL